MSDKELRNRSLDSEYLKKTMFESLNLHKNIRKELFYCQKIINGEGKCKRQCKKCDLYYKQLFFE